MARNALDDPEPWLRVSFMQRGVEDFATFESSVRLGKEVTLIPEENLITFVLHIPWERERQERLLLRHFYSQDVQNKADSLMMPGFRMTRRLFERIAALCTRLPIAVVAQMAKLSWATVAKVDGRAIEMALGDRPLDLQSLRWIGVDEVSWTGGRKYFTIVTDLRTGREVWIGEG